MGQQNTTDTEKSRISTRRKGTEWRSDEDRRANGEDRRQTNYPVVIERRADNDRRAASDRRELERRSGRDRRNDPWPA